MKKYLIIVVLGILAACSAAEELGPSMSTYKLDGGTVVDATNGSSAEEVSSEGVSSEGVSSEAVASSSLPSVTLLGNTASVSSSSSQSVSSAAVSTSQTASSAATIAVAAVSSSTAPAVSSSAASSSSQAVVVVPITVSSSSAVSSSSSEVAVSSSEASSSSSAASSLSQATSSSVSSMDPTKAVDFTLTFSPSSAYVTSRPDSEGVYDWLLKWTRADFSAEMTVTRYPPTATSMLYFDVYRTTDEKWPITTANLTITLKPGTANTYLITARGVYSTTFINFQSHIKVSVVGLPSKIVGLLK